MNEAVLILKPATFARGVVGEVISFLEQAKCQIYDLYLLNLTRENVYDAYALIKHFPDHAEVQSFLGGPTLVAALRSGADLEPVGDALELKFACRMFQHQDVTRYWFGAKAGAT